MKSTVAHQKGDISLCRLLLRLWRHLSARRQRQFGLVLVLMLLSALAEVVSLGAVIPFLGILIAPEKIFTGERYPKARVAIPALSVPAITWV